MKTVKSAQREKYEEEALPEVEALWRTALWLTRRWSSAEDLVLKTMAKAYRTWPGSADTVGIKARLFRILVREFSNGGNGTHPPGWFLPEQCESTANAGNGDRHYSDASIDHQELSRLTGMSDVSVKGAIARLRPESRLIMILQRGERFSYADIAYITDLRKNSVRSILGRFRRLIPRYLVQHADCFPIAVNQRPSLLARETSSDGDQCRG